jgi:hypothetical protein
MGGKKQNQCQDAQNARNEKMRNQSSRKSHVEKWLGAGDEPCAVKKLPNACAP